MRAQSYKPASRPLCRSARYGDIGYSRCVPVHCHLAARHDAVAAYREL